MAGKLAEFLWAPGQTWNLPKVLAELIAAYARSEYLVVFGGAYNLMWIYDEERDDRSAWFGPRTAVGSAHGNRDLDSEI
jgi:hypothetical protein